MSNSPEEIRREIEQTRRELASDVDTLHEKVSPSAVASRRVQSAKEGVSNMKERVMGTTSSAGQTMSDGVHSAGGAVADAASSVSGAAAAAPSTARRRTQGNPMAAGLIAFGAGWLVSSLLPASEKERRTAMQVKDTAMEHSETLTGPAKQAAQSAADNLKEPAQQAAESMKSSAAGAASAVQDSATSAKDDVAGQVKESKDRMSSDGASEGSPTLNSPVGSTTGGGTSTV